MKFSFATAPTAPAHRHRPGRTALCGVRTRRAAGDPDRRVAARRSGAGPFIEQFAAYFAGRLHRFDLPLAARGTPFQQSVWRALGDIPYGETVSYLEIAQAIGNPKAVRAVGAANGRNPLSIIVPCHRVIYRSGELTGYAGGLPIKRWLLALEQQTDDNFALAPDPITSQSHCV